jgi:hypothetical protein
LRATKGFVDTYNYFAGRKSPPQKIIIKYVIRGYHLSPYAPEAIYRAMIDYVHHCTPCRPDCSQSAVMLCERIPELVPTQWFLYPFTPTGDAQDSREVPGEFILELKATEQFNTIAAPPKAFVAVPPPAADAAPDADAAPAPDADAAPAPDAPAP